MSKDRILVTSALPYANGPLHIGHAIGAYIPADVYVRYNRLKGNDVIFICGTDEHGTPITVTADQEGISPREVVDRYHEIQLKAFEELGVKFNNFSGTARKIHYKLSQEFFLNVLKKNYIEKKTVERPYCPKCKRFLPDRYVKGTCPNCDSKDERGDQCEACGKQLEPHELKNPYCDICHGTPKMRETEHWFFKLSKFGSKLEKWVKSDQVSENLPSNARNFALGWIREGLKDRAITRDMVWGVPIPEKDLDGNPVEGRDGKVLYVWFDAPIGYISSTKEWDEKRWEDYWKKPCKIVHFIGKDNIPFHIVMWPAMLMAHGNYNLPWQIASNEFLNLEGKKMSTSRGWVIWLHDILNEFEPDVIRYYLLSTAPETSDSDFFLKEFREKVNNELIATLGNFVNRTLTFIDSKKGGVVPEPDIGKELLEDIISNSGVIQKEGLLHPSDSGITPDILTTIRDAPTIIGGDPKKKTGIVGFKLKIALSYLLAKAQDGNIFFQKNEPWKGDSDTTLFLCTNLCRTLAILMYPFLPFSAERVWKMLNLKGSVAEQSWEAAGELGIKAGHKIGKVEVLYRKIEDEDIESFKNKYLPTGVKKTEVKPMVDISEFEKLDLRIGKIKSVEEHPNAEKLVVLKVDLGALGEKQLVAGIKETYTEKDLIGKQIIVIANLKPAKIRGVMSEGMLLAALENGKPTLLIPEKSVKTGSKVA